MKAKAHYNKFIVNCKPAVLRSMRSDDTDRLLAYINQLAEEKRTGEYPDIFTGFEQKLTRRKEAEWLVGQIARIKGGEMVSVLAEVNGQVVANGEITRGGYIETRHHGRLALTVLASHRGLGIGRSVVRVLLYEARKMGLKNVEVEFLSTNQAAVHTYLRAGFREAGRIPGKVRRRGRSIDSIIMARRL